MKQYFKERYYTVIPEALLLNLRYIIGYIFGVGMCVLVCTYWNGISVVIKLLTNNRAP